MATFADMCIIELKQYFSEYDLWVTNETFRPKLELLEV
jgi:hypothetical protein